MEQRIDVLPLEYPDFFEPISEEEEKIEEAEKLLEDKGYQVIKNAKTGSNISAVGQAYEIYGN